MNLTSFSVLTFDCYGTLIDWETGIHRALANLIGRTGRRYSPDQALEAFARHESEQEAETGAMPANDGIRPNDGEARRVPLTLRIDTPIEVDYYRHGGILPFVLRQLLAA